jgi:hypothetical protein
MLQDDNILKILLLSNTQIAPELHEYFIEQFKLDIYLSQIDILEALVFAEATKKPDLEALLDAIPDYNFDQLPVIDDTKLNVLMQVDIEQTMSQIYNTIAQIIAQAEIMLDISSNYPHLQSNINSALKEFEEKIYQNLYSKLNQDAKINLLEYLYEKDKKLKDFGFACLLGLLYSEGLIINGEKLFNNEFDDIKEVIDMPALLDKLKADSVPALVTEKRPVPFRK